MAESKGKAEPIPRPGLKVVLDASYGPLFCRQAWEEDETCHLNWAGTPEKAIKGYHVYRMDERNNTAQIPRLTAEPIAAMTYRDPTADRLTRRLLCRRGGRSRAEGFPSTPAWFEREWKKFHRPFTGEWHQ